MLPEELAEWAIALGLPRYAGRQLSDWIYKKKVVSFDEMTNLSLKHRALLSSCAVVGRAAPIASFASKDGTKKYLSRLLQRSLSKQFLSPMEKGLHSAFLRKLAVR